MLRRSPAANVLHHQLLDERRCTHGLVLQYFCPSVMEKAIPSCTHTHISYIFRVRCVDFTAVYSNSRVSARLTFHRKSQKGGTAFYKSTWLKCHLNCDELRSVYLSIYHSTLYRLAPRAAYSRLLYHYSYTGIEYWCPAVFPHLTPHSSWEQI